MCLAGLLDLALLFEIPQSRPRIVALSPWLVQGAGQG